MYIQAGSHNIGLKVHISGEVSQAAQSPAKSFSTVFFPLTDPTQLVLTNVSWSSDLVFSVVLGGAVPFQGKEKEEGPFLGEDGCQGPAQQW